MKILTSGQTDKIHAELAEIQKSVAAPHVGPITRDRVVKASQAIVETLLEAEEIKISVER